MLDAKEMEFNYMTAACQILWGLGPAGHLTVVQEGFKISHSTVYRQPNNFQL